MESLGSLYHWSPKDRRAEIIRHGLVVGSESTVSSAEFHVVCFGTSPRAAWCLSGDMAWAQEIEEWDLWQVFPSDHDDIRIRHFWGKHIVEVRMGHTVPPDRVWWVGERTLWGIPVPRAAVAPKPRRKKA